MKTGSAIMMKKTNTDISIATSQEVCRFLSEYSTRLLGCGATCIRLEKNVQRIALNYGKEIEITIMPRHVHLSVWDKEHPEPITAISSVQHAGISFNINTRLSELSWEIVDKKLNIDEAWKQFENITADDKQEKWLVLLLVTLANASFCRLFGGDIAAMLVVGVATFIGYCLKFILLAKSIDLRAVVLASSFVSSVLGATDCLFAIGTTPQIALGSSVLYLIPGIPFLTSFSDMLYRYYTCAFSRFADAAVLTACLSVGLCGGMLLMNIGMF